VSLYQRGRTWWLYIRHDGERIRESTGTQDKREAQRIHDQRRAEVWRKKRQGTRLSDALALWLKAAPRNEREKSAIRVLLSVYQDRPIDQIAGGGKAITSALSGRSASTINRTLNIVRAAINMAHADGLIDHPIKIARLKQPASRIRYLTPEEWARLAAELPEHILAPARFALATGLRKSNVLGLQWREVDLRRAVAWIHPDQAKAGKAISVPLNTEAMAVLKAERGKHDTHVFTYAGRPIGNIKRAWTSALKRADIHDFTWHDLRHTWASWHVMAGTPLAVLKELGGWSSMDMVLRYAHLEPGHLKQWADKSRPQKRPQSKRKTA